ncbi:MAG TPA: ABC transporter permease [Candidatus Angelobacter sp.]|nr:ABC transporter permease [Candidatus Angelobacter sp.]
MGQYLADLRFALRTLLKNPGFTLIALLTLALGIGANTAIFSVVNAVLLRPLPYPDPNQIVQVYQTDMRRGIDNNGVSYPNVLDWRKQNEVFSEIAGYRESSFTMTGHGDPATVYGASITPSLFSLLRVRPVLGRLLTWEDENIPVAVISDGLWQDVFKSESAVIGSVVALDQQQFTIIGVMPREFQFPYTSTHRADIWISLHQDPAYKALLASRGGHYLSAIARLKPGITMVKAQESMSVVSDRLAKQFPSENTGWGIRLVSLRHELVGNVEKALFSLLGAVILLLLIACSNLVNLLLARLTVRRQEVAIRTALGASRRDLIRQIMMESVLLSLLGGVAGLLLAFVGTRLMMVTILSALPHIHEIKVDQWVLLFTFSISVLVGIFSGIIQLAHNTRTDIFDSLKDSGRTAFGGRAVLRTRNLLVTGEVAVAMILLVGAGLLMRSFARLQGVDLGFTPDHVMVTGIALPRAQYAKPEQWVSFYQQVLQRVQGLPGVQSAAQGLVLPLTRSSVNFGFTVEGRPATPGVHISADYNSVSPDYFRAMSIALLRGRPFADTDTPTSPPVAIINETFARRYFPNEDPIGKKIVFGYREIKPREIVGVVADTKVHGLGESPLPYMYTPNTQMPWWVMNLILKTSGDVEGLAEAVHRQVLQMDSALPMEQIEPLDRTLEASVAQPRFRTFLFCLFAILALFLATIGIYGVMSYSVTQRTREIGIRMALGANQQDIMRLILRQGMITVLIGFAIGIVGSLFGTRLISSLLYSVKPTDPWTFAGATLLLMVVSFVAAYIPAHRAMRLSAVQALQE